MQNVPDRKLRLSALLWILFGSPLSQLILFFGSGISVIAWVALTHNAPTWFVVAPVALFLFALAPMVKAPHLINTLKKGFPCRAVVNEVHRTKLLVGTNTSGKRPVHIVVCEIQTDESPPIAISYKSSDDPPHRGSQLPCVCLRHDPHSAVLTDRIGYGLEVNEHEIRSKAHAFGISLLAIVFLTINFIGVTVYFRG